MLPVLLITLVPESNVSLYVTMTFLLLTVTCHIVNMYKSFPSHKVCNVMATHTNFLVLSNNAEPSEV